MSGVDEDVQDFFGLARGEMEGAAAVLPCCRGPCEAELAGAPAGDWVAVSFFSHGGECGCG